MSSAEAGLTYDFCLSYSSKNRRYVKRVAAALEKAGLRVFYDQHQRSKLTGENLYPLLCEIYRSARYCVAFLSAAYARSYWTTLELEAAQSRALEDRDYLVFGRFDQTELPGVLKTAHYTDLNKTGPESFADILIEKIHQQKPPLTWRRRVSDFLWRRRIALRIASTAFAAVTAWAGATEVRAPSVMFVGATENVITLRVAARWKPLRIERCALTFDKTLPIQPVELRIVNADQGNRIIEPVHLERIGFKVSELELKDGVQEEEITGLIDRAKATIEIQAMDGNVAVRRSDTFDAALIRPFIHKWVADNVPTP